MTPTTYGRDFAYCLKSHGGVRGFNASLWRFLLRCTLFCHSVATFLTSVSSYEGGCGFEVIETHSEAILNSVGIEIEQNNLDKDKANIVLFNAAEEGYENYIEEAQYNERGFVEHWPTGFLSEDVY